VRVAGKTWPAPLIRDHRRLDRRGWAVFSVPPRGCAMPALALRIRLIVIRLMT
jgi:hypothetical protein